MSLIEDQDLTKAIQGEPSAALGGSTVIQGTQAAAATPAGQPEVANRVVSQNETVQGQLKGLIEGNSPFIEQARTNAKGEANKRGLLNSNMAVSAGEQAAYAAALPVASADADKYTSAGDINTQNQNLFGMAKFNEGSTSRLSNQEYNQNRGLSDQDYNQKMVMSNQDYNEARGLSDLDYNQKLSLANQDYNIQNALQTSLQTLKGQQATDVAQIEANYRTLMQTSDSAARTFTQTSANIQTILSDPNIPADQKQAHVDAQINLLRASLAIQGGISNLNLEGLLTFA